MTARNTAGMSSQSVRGGVRISWWPWAMIAAAVTLVVGGFLHPDQDPNAPEEAILAAWLGDPLWVPSHSLLLVGAILLVPGLLGLLGGRPDLPAAARRAGWVAVAGAALWVVEGVPHLAAAAESAAAAAGQPTPLLVIHQLLALVAFPLVGLSIAGLAVLGGRQLAHPVLAALAAAGGVAWTAAPWAVGPLGIESLGWLFPVGMLMAPWFLAVGVGELARRRAGTPRPASTASGPPRV